MFSHDGNQNRWVKVPMAILFGAAMVLLIGWVTMSLWNFTVPELFHGPVIDYWQAIALLILSKILFGGFHGKSHHKRHRGSCNPDCGPGSMGKDFDKQEWSRYIQRMMWMKQMQKVYWMKHLSPEEREKMKEEWKKGWTEDFKPWEDDAPKETS